MNDPKDKNQERPKICVMCLKPAVKVCAVTVNGSKPCHYPLCEKCEHRHQ